ncbi:radical SAM/SPASM domain-containing protein [Bacillus sp. FJAT-42315]|uniref:radical SAM/SPASM domain-containing protein n=1 Tax=Bacillus sp. FJAT-42315 TaxID=2014077 RepID=UPI001E2D6564|nr:radical SAM protein [Bacillus sp. FJAT-42315]
MAAIANVTLTNYIQFEVANKEYLFHGLTGNIIELDGLSKNMVQTFTEHGERVADTWTLSETSLLQKNPAFTHVLTELEQMEMIQRENDRQQRFSMTPPPPSTTENMPVKTLVFHLVNECNLRCTYCYAGDGEYGAPQKYMSVETADQAIRFLMENSFDEKEVNIVLFGGEPFLNWKTLKYVVEQATVEGEKYGKRVGFSLTTNGSKMSEAQMAFLHQYKVMVSVSMDGTKEAHDRHRPLAGGQGSYDRVSQNVEKLMNIHNSAPIGTRVTVVKDFEKLETSLKHLLSKGFYEVGFAPVTETNMNLALNDKDLKELLRQFEELTDLFVEHALKNEYVGFSNLTNLLKELHIGTNKAYGCGAGLGFFAVSPDGGLFLCHRFNENEEFRMGDIFFGIDQKKRANMLDELHVDRKPTCHSCALKHICSGGCYYEAMERQGDYRAPNAHYCNWMHEWITIGLKAYVKILQHNPTFLEKISGTTKERCVSN